MKNNNKHISTTLHSELFKLFNESLNYTPEQMKRAIAEATRALDDIDKEEEMWVDDNYTEGI